MTVLGLLIMIQTFEKTDSFDVQSNRGRKIINSTVVEELATAVHEETSSGEKSCSYRGIV